MNDFIYVKLISNHELINNILKTHSIFNAIPRLEVEILLTHVLNIDRVTLKAHPEMLVSAAEAVKFYQLLNRRLKGEPIAYIIGSKNFWDLNLIITKDVLIPRSETELLVEKTLEILAERASFKNGAPFKNRAPFENPISILELGTGSGAVSLAIAKSYPDKVKIIATDISKDALEIAKLNAKRLNINNIQFLHGDWFKALEFNHKISNKFKFDFIISNPPYISSKEIHLCNGEIFFEPQIALFANDEGLASLQHIIMHSKNYLNDSGILLVEHGIYQRSEVVDFFLAANFKTITSYQDLLAIDRVIVGS